MLSFGVTIPATVLQRSEILGGLMNYPVHNFCNRWYIWLPLGLNVEGWNVVTNDVSAYFTGNGAFRRTNQWYNNVTLTK
jgi:hypothetical protein